MRLDVKLAGALALALARPCLGDRLLGLGLLGSLDLSRFLLPLYSR
jgi:hypothetical protein